MKILLSPCHYMYDEGFGGSEQSWAFEIGDYVAERNEGSVVVTGFKKILSEKKYKIIEVQKKEKELDMSIKNAIKFSFLYSIETYKQNKNNDFHIVHHVLPFSIKNTFNFYILTNFFQKKRFIIGPIQPGLTFRGETSIKNDTFGRLNKNSLGMILVKKLISPIISSLSYMTLLKADRLIVINEYTKSILKKMGIKNEKIIVIPPGVNTSRFIFKEKETKIIQILTTGYLLKRKRIDLIIKAIYEVSKKTKVVFSLRIVGNGPEEKNLKKIVAELGLEKYIIFEGFIPNHAINKFYETSHLYLSMSESEGFATVCLEAMSSGLPIISSRVGGFVDAVIENETGFIVDNNDYLKMAEKILYFLNNTEKINEYGIKSRKIAEIKYDWKKCIMPQYIKVYDELL